MSKPKKISHRKKGAMATSIGALSLVTGGLVSAGAAPTTSGNPVTKLAELVSSQVNLPETLLVAENFEFTGISGMGTVQVSASSALPERYEFRASNERLGLVSWPLSQIQGLQNGDTITVEIFDTQTRGVYPFIEPIDIAVSGLRDLDAELQTATFVFEGISGNGHIDADQTTLPPGFLYEASVNGVDWKPLIQNGALANKDQIFVRISNGQAGEKMVTTQPREITVTGLMPNRNIPITLDNYGEYLTPEAFSFNGLSGKMSIPINPGYELPDGYEYRVYVKRQAEAEGKPYTWPRLEEVHNLIDGDAIAIVMMSPDGYIFGEGLNMVVKFTTPSEYLQPEFFSIVDGKVVAKPPKPLPTNAYYEFWVGGQDGWVREQDTKDITPTTYVYVRLNLNMSVDERSVISDYITLPNAAKKFLVPEAFAFLGFSNNMSIQIQPGFELPADSRYEVVVRGPQGTNGGRGPILSTTNLADVHSLKDGDVIEIAMFDRQGQIGEGVNYVVDLLDPREYLQPEFFSIVDGKVVANPSKPLPTNAYYEFWVGGQDGWVKEQDTKDITPTTYVYVRLNVSVGERRVISDYITLPNAAKKFLVPEAFLFLGFSNSDDMFIQIQPGFELPADSWYEVVVRGPQGTNGGRGPILSTTNLADVHSLKDGDVIEIAMFDRQGQIGEGVNYVVDLLDPSEYLKPEFFGLLDDGTMVERKPLPAPYYYEWKVGYPAPEDYFFGGGASPEFEDEQKEFEGTYVRIHDLPKITADLPDIEGGNPNASSPFTVVYVRIGVSDPNYNIKTRALEMWIHTG